MRIRVKTMFLGVSYADPDPSKVEMYHEYVLDGQVLHSTRNPIENALL